MIKLENIGKTVEGRDIHMLKVEGFEYFQSFSSQVQLGTCEKPKAILLTGAHHSRELLSI